MIGYFSATDDMLMDKRVPSGFMGMRGKKASTDDQQQEEADELANSNGAYDERNMNSYSDSFGEIRIT